MHISLIPALKGLAIFQQGVIARSLHPEGAGAVALELPTHQGDVFGRIQKAVAGTMERHQGATRFHPVNQSFLLGRGDLRMVGINGQRIVFGQHLRVEHIEAFGVFHPDTAVSHQRCQLAIAQGRLMMPLVSQEQDLQARPGCAGLGRFFSCHGLKGASQQNEGKKHERDPLQLFSAPQADAIQCERPRKTSSPTVNLQNE